MKQDQDVKLDTCVLFYQKLRTLILEGVPEDAVQVYANWVVNLPEDRIANAEPILGYDGSLAIEWEGAEGANYVLQIMGKDMWLCRLASQNDFASDVDYEGSVDYELMTRFYLEGGTPWPSSG